MAARAMQYRRVGRSGLKVSAFGLGGWTTFGGSVKDEAVVKDVVRKAREAGVNLFDIADVYAGGEAEVLMGRAFAEHPRHELVITSKLFWPASEDVNDRGLSRKHVMESIERSLRRIGTDYLDVYFCHRFDPDTELDETARAMDDLIRQGKVLYWGTSEWAGDQLREARVVADSRNLDAPIVEQPQYSLVARGRVESDVRPAAQELGMGLMAWSPLGSGVLTGKYDAGLPPGSRLERIAWLRDSVGSPENVERARRLAPLAQRLGCTRAQLALAWVAAQPGISSVLLGVTGAAQLAENLAAGDVEIDSDTAAELDRLFPAQ